MKFSSLVVFFLLFTFEICSCNNCFSSISGKFTTATVQNGELYVVVEQGTLVPYTTVFQYTWNSTQKLFIPNNFSFPDKVPGTFFNRFKF